MINIISSKELKRLREVERRLNVMLNHVSIRKNEEKSYMTNEQSERNLQWCLLRMRDET